MLLDELEYRTDLVTAKADIPGQRHRAEPRLEREFRRVSIDVRRFIRLMAVKNKNGNRRRGGWSAMLVRFTGVISYSFTKPGFELIILGASCFM